MTRLNSRLLVFPLFKDLIVTTTGVGGQKSTMNLDVAGFRNILPHADALFLITHTDGLPASGAMEWNVTCYSGMESRFEPFPAFDVSTVNFDIDGHKRSNDYTTVANFMLESRLELWWANVAGVGGVKRAEISAALGVRTFGS